MMSQLFKPGPQIEIDVYQITRIERQEERPEHHDCEAAEIATFSSELGTREKP